MPSALPAGDLSATADRELARKTFNTSSQKEDCLMASINVRPLHDRILIKRIEEQETVKGGIIIPDTAKEKPQEGEVIAVGTGRKKEDGKIIPLDVKAGDRILFGKYSGTDIRIADEEYLIVREEEVLAVLEPAAVGAKK